MTNSNCCKLYFRKFKYQIIVELLLALFGGIVLSMGEVVLDRRVYMLVFALFVITTFLFLRNSNLRKYAHILDLLFVFVLIYGRPIDNVVVFAFLLYPLVSRWVYIDRFTYDKFFIIEYLSLVVLANLFSDVHDGWYYCRQILVFLTYMCLDIMHVQRIKNDEKISEMLDIAENFFVEQNNSYEVYGKILEYLKKQNINASSITCVEWNPDLNRKRLVNSSSLVSTYSLPLYNNNINHLIKSNPVHDVFFSLNGEQQPHNIVYPVAQAKDSPFSFLLFVVVYQSGYSILKNLDLEPLFLRISRLIAFERIIRNKRDAKIQDLIQKSRFVNGAVNIMHFLRNRLTPLQTLVDLANNEGGVRHLQNYNELLMSTARSAQKEIDVIQDKAKYLLNKQNNPFLFTKEECNIWSIYVTLSSIWMNLLPDADEIGVTMGAADIAVYDSNIEGLEILFSDIVANMRKYSKKHQRCLLEQDEQSVLMITFENDHSNKKEIQLLVNDINNPHKDAVIYRTSHGVTNIRAISENLSIGLKANSVNKDGLDWYQLVLKFEPKKNKGNEKDINY